MKKQVHIINMDAVVIVNLNNSIREFEAMNARCVRGISPLAVFSFLSASLTVQGILAYENPRDIQQFRLGHMSSSAFLASLQSYFPAPEAETAETWAQQLWAAWKAMLSINTDAIKQLISYAEQHPDELFILNSNSNPVHLCQILQALHSNRPSQSEEEITLSSVDAETENTRLFPLQAQHLHQAPGRANLMVTSSHLYGVFNPEMLPHIAEDIASLYPDQGLEYHLYSPHAPDHAQAAALRWNLHSAIEWQNLAATTGRATFAGM